MSRYTTTSRFGGRFPIPMSPSYWPTLSEVESLCDSNVVPMYGMLRPDMSLLDWQQPEESFVGFDIVAPPPKIEKVMAPAPKRVERQTPPPKHTAWDSLINGLSRWSAKSRVRRAVRALGRVQARPAALPRVAPQAPRPRAEMSVGVESAFVPLGRRHVFLTSDGCWHCMNGDVTEANGKGDYMKLLGMETSCWFELLRSAGVPA